MRYIKVAQANELKDGEKKKITLENKVLLLVKLNGTYYAIDNKCPHMGGSLYDGALEGTSIVCPRHGTAFDVRSGEVVKRGKLAFISVKANNAQIYSVKIEQDDVLVGIG